MVVLAAAVLALQVQITIGAGGKPATSRDSTDTTHVAGRRAPRRIPVTPEALATAFRDAKARTMLLAARDARLRQDSALLSYDATTFQRISAGLGFSKIGRDRLVFRTESATRVRWHRDVGAWVELTGQRTALPGIPVEGERDAQDDLDDESDMWPIPYYPGYEQLWIGGAARASVNDREIVNPIADGAEAYYTYQSGDSIDFRLPDGRAFQLRELKVRPREPKWNVAVGSLWFDVASAQLVRAAYRLSVPIDIWVVARQEDEHAMDDVPIWVKPLISPMHAEVSAVAIEYGLHDGRFWLPRTRSVEGRAQVSFMRVPFSMQQTFRYASVNALDSLPEIRVASSIADRLDSLPDSLREAVRDSIRYARRARRDSVRKGLIADARRPAACDTSAYQLETRRNFQETGLRVAYRIPCDRSTLEHSPDLPPSIFDSGDALFGATERDALIAEALSISAQPEFSIVPTVPMRRNWGLQFMRYNRVEGFSAGGMLEQQFGGGYTARGLARLGIADLDPNVELSVERSNLSRTIRFTGYHRLVSANDWGAPLSFGSSLSAFLFGRDEGFYYKATGGELLYTRERGARFDWRFFAERQLDAEQNTDFSLAHASHGADFPANLRAREATFVGSSMRVTHTRGLDPSGFRVFTDLRVEAAAGDSAYGRGALDLTFTQGFGRAAGAITLAGGSSIGAVPAQRHWYLGGSRTIRGQSPDTAQSGNAFWMTRAELGYGIAAARPVLFGDLGWVGDREALDRVGRPLSGAGVGASFMDGLIRFDVARGIHPRRQWRVDLYIDASF